MTVLTQPRSTLLEQRRVGGTVWRVAAAAVVGDRAMFPKERAALFGMAGVAGLVDGVLHQQLGTGGTVRIVAIRAGHFAGMYRVYRDALELRALGLVTAFANLRLRDLAENRIVRHVHLVATAAREIMILMLAARPVHPFAGLVATKAHFVLGVGGRSRLDFLLAAEDHVRVVLGILDVLIAAAMARLTRGRPSISLDAVTSLVDRHDPSILLVVAFGAHCVAGKGILRHAVGAIRAQIRKRLGITGMSAGGESERRDPEREREKRCRAVHCCSP